MRRPALLAPYFRTCLHRNGVGSSRDVAERYAASMSREQLTAAIIATWETA